MTNNISASQLRKLFAVAFTFLVLPAVANAATVTFGPTPYLEGSPIAGQGDTPVDFFDFSHPDCIAFIEDFELGVTDPFLSIDGGPNGGILAPNSFSGLAMSVTDSVDGDDGVVDGNGNGGYSYFAEGQQLSLIHI